MGESVAFVVTALAIVAVTALAWRFKRQPSEPQVSRLRVTKRRRRAMRATRGVPDAFAEMGGAPELLKRGGRNGY